LHAGHKNGFLKGCDYFLHSKIEHRDYHRTMNGDLFKNWVENQLIPALRELSGKTVIIMDNAPYRSVVLNKLPTSNVSKSKLQEWASSQNITFDQSLNKKNLWNVIKPYLDQARHNRKYEIDEILFKQGYEVLRLPPYHCQYNPIEMVWGYCKSYYNKHIRSQPRSKDKVTNLWKTALSNYTPQMWANSVAHCEKLIKDDWQKLMGNFPIDDIPPIIISLAESDEESSEFSSDAESNYDLPLEKRRKLNNSLDFSSDLQTTNYNDSNINGSTDTDSDVETITIEVI
jgi:transposase